MLDIHVPEQLIRIHLRTSLAPFLTHHSPHPPSPLLGPKMSSGALAYTFTTGIRAGVWVSPLPTSQLSVVFAWLEKLMSLLPGNGLHGSPLRLDGLSPPPPPCSCCLHSDRLQPPIPPLEGARNGRAPDTPGTDQHALRFFRRPKVACSTVVFFGGHSAGEIDVSIRLLRPSPRSPSINVKRMDAGRP